MIQSCLHTSLPINKQSRGQLCYNFCQRVDYYLTMEHQAEVISVVEDAITKGELPASASNLIVDHPRTSRFYFLPKIHKPGNPGRPIVSACNCPTELLATYLDQITSLLVRSLPSYVKDSNHMLDIAQCFRYPTTVPDRFVFTMDIKSLYTVIPNNDGLLALRHFLNKRPVQEPPSHTLVRLAELVLTLNSFSFKGDYFQQTGGVAMGSRLGPNYSCLFVGHVEEQIFQQYPGKKPDLYKRYIDDIAGAASCSKNELDNFAEFINNFHPSLKFTWAISDNQLPFLDLLLKSKEMASFFLQRDYPLAVVDRALQHVDTIPRDTALRPPKRRTIQQRSHPLNLNIQPHQPPCKEHPIKKLRPFKI